MKKILSMLVVVSIVVLSAMGAFAATDFTPDDNGRYTVVVDGLQAGEMYGMVAIKGTQASQITEANIVYIDQATADSEGKITFTSFGTMGATPDSEDFVEATVFVGGAGLSSATVVGTLKAAEADEPVIPDEPEVPAGVPGDIDASGACDDNDAIYLLMYALVGEDMYPIPAGFNADVDNNGMVDDNDAIYLLMYALVGEDMYPLYPAN